MDKREGVSDFFESCMHSYRALRGDSPITIELNDFEITDAIEVTIHNGQNRDSWMHCWFTLRFPKDEKALESLKKDISKMKKEFGSNYAFIPAPYLNPFIERLQKISDKPLYCGEVEYTGNKQKWGNLSKALEYSYQREYRFLFGECSPSETEYYIFYDSSGFDQFIFKNTEFKISSKFKTHTWFDLSA